LLSFEFLAKGGEVGWKSGCPTIKTNDGIREVGKMVLEAGMEWPEGDDVIGFFLPSETNDRK
jgi:hypothetical protein